MKKKNSKAEILKMLKERSGQFFSGTILSRKLGVSRTAVWKQINSLRSDGYTISSVTNRGYRLEAEPVTLDSKLLEINNIVYKRSVDSTNCEARLLAESGAHGFSTIVAEEQLQGRGRLGRYWLSPPECGLWFSILLRPTCLTPAEAAPITLVTAAAIAGYFREKQHLPVKVKWPNDLLINGKKFGGILTELKGEPDRIEYLIVGTGLNIGQTIENFPPDLRDKATSLHLESGISYNRTSLLLEINKSLVDAYKLFFRKGFKAFYENWKGLSSTLGQKVTIRWPGGTLSGKAVDLNDSGALIIIDSKGVRHQIHFGEIT